MKKTMPPNIVAKPTVCMIFCFRFLYHGLASGVIVSIGGGTWASSFIKEQVSSSSLLQHEEDEEEGECEDSPETSLVITSFVLSSLFLTTHKSANQIMTTVILVLEKLLTYKQEK